MADMMRLGPDRGAKLPIVPLLLIVLPVAAGYGSYEYVQRKAIKPLQERISTMKKAADASQSDQDKISKDVERMKRQIGALQAIAKVEIVWGGASGDRKVEAKDLKVDFAYTRNGSVWVSPRESGATVWYYTDEGDTLGRIAAQPRVMGAYWMWPILAAENGLKVTGSDSLSAGTMIRVPARVNEGQIRHAITEAGTPDKARDEIFSQTGLK